LNVASRRKYCRARASADGSTPIQGVAMALVTEALGAGRCALCAVLTDGLFTCTVNISNEIFSLSVPRNSAIARRLYSIEKYTITI